MTSPTPSPHPTPAGPPRPGRRWPKALLTLATLAVAGAAVWYVVGREMFKEYNRWREEVRAAEDNVPIGYLGLNYRRSYNDRPTRFLETRDGRTLLFAARPGGGNPDETYDVTDAAIDMTALDGGFGRDSIPGIDYPILETVEGERGKNLRGRQAVFGVVLADGPRAYPRDLLEKIEMVNDRDGETPFTVIFDRAKGTARAFKRGAFTLGTTGYTRARSPVLYDRKARGLWTFEGGEFVSVSGPSKGQALEPFGVPLTATTWGEWQAKYPRTSVVVGNDRGKPIPAE